MFQTLISMGVGLRDAGRQFIGHSFDALPSARQIDRMIVRETARAERNGKHFSVVLFRVKGSRTGASRKAAVSERRLARTLSRRIRLTDEVGWFDEKHLCVLLTDTPAAGARVFAEGVCDELARKKVRTPSQRPSYVIYTYPDNGPDSDAGSGGSGDPPRFNGENRVRGLLDEIEEEQREPVKPLHALLARPLPAWKRCLDIAVSALALVLLFPLFAAVAVGIKLTSPGPVFFKQRRSGLGGQPFTIFKFRTMCVDAEAKKQALRARSEQDGPAFKLTNDPRVTRIGSILRKTSVDELPQLLNVLKGEMSLVGPRPLPIDESNGCQVWQKRRLDVTPGLTCIWQVEGRSTVSFADWVRMDVKYMRRLTLMHDLMILFRTVPAVLLRRGAR